MRRGATERLDTIESVNGVIVFLLAGAATLCAIGAAMGANHPLLSLSALLFGGFIAVLVHEIGHAIAAWLVGWRVWIIHVAPFALRLDSGSLRFVGDYGGPDFAGFVLPSPTAPHHDTKLRAAFVSAGGPIASWIMAAVLIAIAVPGPIVRYEVSDIRYILYALGLFSLASAIATSLPLVTNGRRNDAAQIRDFLDGSLKRHPHALWALGLWAYGVDPKYWNAELRSSVDAVRAAPGLAWIPACFDFIAAVRANDASAARATFNAFGAEFNEAKLQVLEGFIQATIEANTIGASDILSHASPEAVPAEVQSLRELALVDIDRAAGQTAIARNRLARVHAQVSKSPYGRQPHWPALFQAAEARFAAR